METKTSMIKLYKRTEEGLFYHEAWITGMQIIEHKGKVGTTGEAFSFDYTKGQPDELSLERTLKAARKEGFMEIPPEAHHEVSLRWNFESTPTDLKKINEELEEILNEILGWQGLGEVQNITANNRQSEVRCLVVDLEVTVNRFSEVLLESRYSGYEIHSS